MTNRTECPIRLARTQQGEIILHADCECWYMFRFGRLERCLTPSEFYRLHDSALAFDLEQVPIKPIQLEGEIVPRVALTITLFGSLTRADLLELKELLGRAALMITSLSRAWNDVN